MENNTFTIMSEIARRFIGAGACSFFGGERDTLDVIMDLDVVHKRTPLDLEAMRDGPIEDLARDVILITLCVERRGPDAGKLNSDKIPRYMVINETAREAFPFND